MGKEITVAKVGEIPPGSCKQVEVDDEPVGIYNLDGNFYAIHDMCTHAQAYLTDGTVTDGKVKCPLHGAEFDIKSGKNLCMPAPTPVEKYEVKVEGDEIRIVV